MLACALAGGGRVVVDEWDARQAGAEDHYRVCRGWRRRANVDDSLRPLAKRQEPEKK